MRVILRGICSALLVRQLLIHGSLTYNIRLRAIFSVSIHFHPSTNCGVRMKYIAKRHFWPMIGHILRRNCLLKQVIEGKIKGEMEVTRRRGRRRKNLLDDLKDRRGYSHLKEEALDRTMWRNRFGGGFGPVVRQNIEWMKDIQGLLARFVSQCLFRSWYQCFKTVLCLHLEGDRRKRWVQGKAAVSDCKWKFINILNKLITELWKYKLL